MKKSHKISVALSALAIVAFPGTAWAGEDKCEKKNPKACEARLKVSQRLNQRVEVKSSIDQRNDIKVKAGKYADVNLDTYNDAESTPTTVTKVEQRSTSKGCGCRSGSVKQDLEVDVKVDASITQENNIDIKAKKGSIVTVVTPDVATSAPTRITSVEQATDGRP